MIPVAKWMVRTVMVAAVLAGLASAASAAQNVANASQKGSLLIFPLIDVRPGNNTVIRIANDANTHVDVKCYYVNQTKFRRDFVFKLTKKQAVVWDAAHGDAEPIGSLPPFPTASGPIPGNPFLGELVCFAVNAAGSAQISHNHLSGTATVGFARDGAEAVLQSSYEYNSWNFAARDVTIGNRVGTPGRLELTGAAGAYDACPLYNIVHFSPTGSVNGNGTHADYRIGVSSCLQDLRQDFAPHFTKLRFHVWNAHEVKFTGAWECANSTDSFLLTELDVLPENTSRDVLGTTAAHAQIQGIASTQCPGSVAAGLVAVAARVLRDHEREVPLHGTTTNHAGAQPGFILWDPQDDVVPEKAPSR